MTLDKYPESKTVVRFQDCDPFGHLNNTSFINYFINAREDHLRQYYAFDLYEHAKTLNHNWFVGRHEIAYLRPAQLGETIMIKTSLIKLDARSLTVEGVMLDELGEKLKAVQWTNFKYVDLARGRSAVHPDALNALLTSLLIDDVEVGDIDKRILQLKREQPN
ncbi:MAG: acyl-CoA thioesterase [Rhodothermales bacterium]